MSARSLTPDALIEAYVTDVMKRLPRRQRNDVGFELRALLGEELRGRAGDAGRLPDEAMTLELLGGFGHPDEVAARYHPPGVPIIPPSQTRAFAWASFIGIALQWASSLPLAVASGEPNWIGRWWVTGGLGALWWPGFLVVVTMIAAFIRQRWPAASTAWKPKVIDPDHVNRPLYLLGMAGALAGIGFWVLLASWAMTTTSDSVIAKVFEFDAGFLATRAPMIALYWTLGLVLLAVVTFEGRWRSLTRKLNLALEIACCVMLAWLLIAGPVFVSPATDDGVKVGFAALLVMLLGKLVWTAWRPRSRIKAPHGIATHQG
jgi:hypothetical protein